LGSWTGWSAAARAVVVGVCGTGADATGAAPAGGAGVAVVDDGAGLEAPPLGIRFQMPNPNTTAMAAMRAMTFGRSSGLMGVTIFSSLSLMLPHAARE
jgi:hypothetical protein